MSLNIETTETRTMRSPFHEVAPHIESGNKLPYNMKVIRGKVDIPNTTIKRLTDMSGLTITLPPNTFIMCAGIYAVSTLTSAAGCTFTFGLSATSLATTPPLMTTTLTSAIPLADVVAGCAFKYGTIGAATQVTCIGQSANLTNGTVPVLQTAGGTAPTAGTVHVTLLVIEMMPA